MKLQTEAKEADTWEVYPAKYAKVLDAIDKSDVSFGELEVFQKRVLPHTDLDKMYFEREVKRAIEHRDEARALLATHAAYSAEVDEDEEEHISNLNNADGHLRGLLNARDTYEESKTGSKNENPVDLNKIEYRENPVHLESVIEEIQEAFKRIDGLAKMVEEYTAEEEDGMLWTPWVDAEDQVEKLFRAADTLDKASQQIHQLTERS